MIRYSFVIVILYLLFVVVTILVVAVELVDSNN